MSEPAAPAPSSEPKPAADKAPEEWKPEPRQWTWKDVFTAPMLAFKPKCMLVMAVTALVLGLMVRYQPEAWLASDLPGWVYDVAAYVWMTAGVVVFSLAATLVAVFMKADLLDDEFLSFGEALAQYRKRLVPALLVPLFLFGLLGGFKLLVVLGQLVSSIPFGGPVLYALLYPLAFLLGLFVTLLGIAVVLSVFVFPSIIAIRKHGWFDNVVDTFEAVGTKPHVLVGSGLLVGVMMLVALAIGNGTIEGLNQSAQKMPGPALPETEQRAASVRTDAMRYLWNPEEFALRAAGNAGLRETRFDYGLGTGGEVGGFHKVTGTVTGIWQIIIAALVVGYALNLFIGGGMLTYLVVREDDYWDDEDLEDLDKLAKELEEEAKQEAAKAAAEAKPGETPVTVNQPAAAPTAVAPSAPTAVAPAPDKPADPPAAAGTPA